MREVEVEQVEEKVEEKIDDDVLARVRCWLDRNDGSHAPSLVGEVVSRVVDPVELST